MLTHHNLSAIVADVCAIAEIHAQYHTSVKDVNDIQWLAGIEVPEVIEIDTLTVLKEVYNLAQALYFITNAAA